MVSIKSSSRLAVMLAAALTVASCGSADQPDVIAAPADAGESEPTSGFAESERDETGSGIAEIEMLTLAPVDGETVTVTASALGGIRFERPVDSEVLTAGDVVLVTSQIEKAEIVNAYVKLTSQLSSGSQVESVEQYLEVIGLTHDIAPTSTEVTVGELRLTGYEITGNEPVLIFASSRFPADGAGVFGPSNHTLGFIAQTPSGVLDVGVGGATREEAEAMLPTLGTVLASLEFTGPGLDPALPPGQNIEPDDVGPPPPPAESSDDAPAPPLGPPFSPPEPGRYELLNFGMPISVEIADGWFIQPNFPGVVVLTDPTSIGPNDRDVVLVNSIAELLPLAGGPVAAGDPIPVDDIEAILANPPDIMEVSDVERLVLEAENGATTPVVSFAVEIGGQRACSPTEPCELGLVTSYGFVKPLRATDAHRVWWFPDHPHGPAAAIASASEGSGWMTRAEELMATLELSR